jgi:hypothetical protein
MLRNRLGTDVGGRLGSLLGWVFGGIFIAAGLGVALAMNWGVFEWLGSSDWVEVEAKLESVALGESRDSEGSVTHRVEARYRYRFDGMDHVSDRVDFHPGADNLGDYHQREHRRLEAAFRAGQSVTAWVDPQRPERSVLNRDLRPARLGFGLLFAVMFGGAGMLVIVLMRRGQRRQAEVAAFQASHPAQPWAAWPKWRSARLSCDGAEMRGFATLFALFWNLISLPILFIIPGEIADGNRAAAIGLLFPLIGVGLGVWAVREWIRSRRYGASVLTLEQLPVPLGGRLQARLEVPARLQARELSLQVACVRIRRTGSGKNRRTSEQVLWEDSARIAPTPGSTPGSTQARIDLRLPGDRPEASEDDSSNRVVWRVSVTSPEPGVDFRARFELPVFAVAGAGEAESVLDGPLPVEPDAWRETGVEHGYVAGGQQFRFAAYRMAGAAGSALVFGLLFVAIGLFLLIGPGHWFMGGIFAAVGALIAWGGVGMLFNGSEMQIVQGRLRWRRGLARAWREVQAGVIRSIGIEKSGGVNERLYYRIEFRQWGSDKPTVIATWVPNERAARSLAAHLGGLLGVDGTEPA